MKLAPPRTLALAGALASALLAAPCAAQSEAQPPLPSIRLNAGIHVIVAEVAESADERATGLMFRKEMAPNAGMLFAFAAPFAHCFWMRNTMLPLSIAFIADDGTVVNIEDMAPQTTDSHCAAKPVRFALEMNKGWFEAHHVQRGDAIGALPTGLAVE